MSSSNLTSSNKWPNCSFSKEESEEDFAGGSKVEEEDFTAEEDEVVNPSSATPVGYLGITRGSALMFSAHTMHLSIIMLKVSLS